MDRITSKHLIGQVNRLNKVTNSPLEPNSVKNGVKSANIGHYYIDIGYVGVSLERIVKANGAAEDIFRNGHMSKRQLYDRIDAYLLGIESKTV